MPRPTTNLSSAKSFQEQFQADLARVKALSSERDGSPWLLKHLSEAKNPRALVGLLKAVAFGKPVVKELVKGKAMLSTASGMDRLVVLEIILLEAYGPPGVNES